MKLNINLIAKRRFWNAGEEVPDAVVPDWCRIKHRCSDAEARQICARREELRAEAAARRQKTEAKKAAGAKQSA
jgi:hypothetical protein